VKESNNANRYRPHNSRLIRDKGRLRLETGVRREKAPQNLIDDKAGAAEFQARCRDATPLGLFCAKCSFPSELFSHFKRFFSIYIRCKRTASKGIALKLSQSGIDVSQQLLSSRLIPRKFFPNGISICHRNILAFWNFLA
jgi:hypothetical protein